MFHVSISTRRHTDPVVEFKKDLNPKEKNMPRFIIERNIPGASDLSWETLQDIAAKSNDAITTLGEPYNWITSYVAGDKLYCVHEAESAEAVYSHARAGGFPADKVTEVTTNLGPGNAKR
jgi:hypothetical protein